MIGLILVCTALILLVVLLSWIERKVYGKDGKKVEKLLTRF